MHFEIVGEIRDEETIAQGAGIRERARLIKRYGRGRWRKREGFADIRLGRSELLQYPEFVLHPALEMFPRERPSSCGPTIYW